MSTTELDQTTTALTVPTQTVTAATASPTPTEGWGAARTASRWSS